MKNQKSKDLAVWQGLTFLSAGIICVLLGMLISILMVVGIFLCIVSIVCFLQAIILNHKS